METNIIENYLERFLAALADIKDSIDVHAEAVDRLTEEVRMKGERG